MALLDHTIISIRFSAKGLDLEKTAELLGFTKSDATVSIIKRLKNGRVIWTVSIDEHVPVSIEEKLTALLGCFTDNFSVWKTTAENVKADVFCGLFQEGFNQGFSLSPSVLKMLADRDLEIGFDVYAPTGAGDVSAVPEDTEQGL